MTADTQYYVPIVARTVNGVQSYYRKHPDGTFVLLTDLGLPDSLHASIHDPYVVNGTAADLTNAQQLSDVLGNNTLLNRPMADATNANHYFFANDTHQLYQSDGSMWNTVSPVPTLPLPFVVGDPNQVLSFAVLDAEQTVINSADAGIATLEANAATAGGNSATVSLSGSAADDGDGSGDPATNATLSVNDSISGGSIVVSSVGEASGNHAGVLIIPASGQTAALLEVDQSAGVPALEVFSNPNTLKVHNQVEFVGPQNQGADLLVLGGAGDTRGLAVTNTAALDMLEQGTAPAAPPATTGRLYTRDNGGGKVQLVVRFPTGAVQVIATEP